MKLSYQFRIYNYKEQMIIYFLVIISEYNNVLFNFEFTKSIGIMEEDIINRIVISFELVREGKSTIVLLAKTKFS